MTRSFSIDSSIDSIDLSPRRSMTPEQEQRKRQILYRIKGLRANLAELERELNRVELGLPEPYRYDPEWLPPFIRRGHEVQHQD